VYRYTSFGPWQRALARVAAEESFHVKFGKSIMRELACDSDGRDDLQRAVDWLFPLLLEFMGPPGRATDPQLDFRLKGKRVDDLRQDYLRFACPFCAELGLTVPAHLEPDLAAFVLDFPFPCAFDVERKRWDFGCAVPWSVVFERWKARGPRADRHLAMLRRSRRWAVGGREP
jgi:ring-1,2-phenylacetyl-CoA epoxidase subunit PaaA